MAIGWQSCLVVILRGCENIERRREAVSRRSRQGALREKWGEFSELNDPTFHVAQRRSGRLEAAAVGESFFTTSQHLRHQPPWQNRAWVLDAKQRASRLGLPFPCGWCMAAVAPSDTDKER